MSEVTVPVKKKGPAVEGDYTSAMMHTEQMIAAVRSAITNLEHAQFVYGRLPSDPVLKQALDRARNAARNALKHAMGEDL